MGRMNQEQSAYSNKGQEQKLQKCLDMNWFFLLTGEELNNDDYQVKEHERKPHVLTGVDETDDLAFKRVSFAGLVEFCECPSFGS